MQLVQPIYYGIRVAGIQRYLALIIKAIEFLKYEQTNMRWSITLQWTGVFKA